MRQLAFTPLGEVHPRSVEEVVFDRAVPYIRVPRVVIGQDERVGFGHAVVRADVPALAATARRFWGIRDSATPLAWRNAR